MDDKLIAVGKERESIIEYFLAEVARKMIYVEPSMKEELRILEKALFQLDSLLLDARNLITSPPYKSELRSFTLLGFDRWFSITEIPIAFLAQAFKVHFPNRLNGKTFVNNVLWLMRVIIYTRDLRTVLKYDHVGGRPQWIGYRNPMEMMYACIHVHNQFINFPKTIIDHMVSWEALDVKIEKRAEDKVEKIIEIQTKEIASFQEEAKDLLAELEKESVDQNFSQLPSILLKLKEKVLSYSEERHYFDVHFRFPDLAGEHRRALANDIANFLKGKLTSIVASYLDEDVARKFALHVSGNVKESLKWFSSPFIVDGKSAYGSIQMILAIIIKHFKRNEYSIFGNYFETVHEKYLSGAIVPDVESSELLIKLRRNADLVSNTYKELKYKSFESDQSILEIVQGLPDPKTVTQKSEILSLAVESSWTMRIFVPGKQVSAADASQLMWIVTKVLSSIEDVEVILDDWGKGSFWAKLIIKTKSWVARKEVKDILEKGQLAIEEKYLTKPTLENYKTKSEVEKLRKEIEIFPDKEMVKELQQLELREKQLQIEERELEVQIKRIEFVKKLSDLLSNGLAEVDSDFQIAINELLYIEKKDGNLRIGKNLDSIEEAGEAGTETK